MAGMKDLMDIADTQLTVFFDGKTIFFGTFDDHSPKVYQNYIEIIWTLKLQLCGEDVEDHAIKCLLVWSVKLPANF